MPTSKAHCDAIQSIKKCTDPCQWMPLTGLCVQKPLPGQEPTILSTGLAANAKVIYVNIDEKNRTARDGKTWKTAYQNLDEAIDAHKTDDELTLIVAADGIVKINNQINLFMFNGTKLAIYGGFKGGETDLSKIEGKGDFPAYPLVIDGQGKTRIMNAFFGAKKTGTGREIILFGMVLQNGKVGSGEFGGALKLAKTNVEIIYTKWIKNQAIGGGGLFADGCKINIKEKTEFEKNRAETSGGAIVAVNSTVSIDGKTLFTGNEAKTGNSGALRLYDTIFSINQITTFKNNSASVPGTSAFSANKSIEGDVSKIIGATRVGNSNNWVQN